MRTSLCAAVLAPCLLACSSSSSPASTANDAALPGSDAGVADGAQRSDSAPPGEAGSPPDAGPPFDAAGLSGDAGWQDLQSTHLLNVCPPGSDCSPVVSAWNSGVADRARHRLLFWGGGHTDYAGNEIYSLDLGSRALTRLTDPSPPISCSETAADGKPSSRHTYDNLVYMADADRIFMYGGYISCGGGAAGISRATWTLDPSTLAWTRMDPVNGGGPASMADCCDYIAFSDYDPGSRRVLLHDDAHLWSYVYATNTYALLSSDYGVDYHLTGIVDTKRALFLGIGNGQVRAWDISGASSYKMQVWDGQLSGCDALVSAVYPGLAFDPARGVVLGWAGGGMVYELDPGAKACSTLNASGGPGAAQGNGTFKRWSYFPDVGVAALVNQANEDAFLFHLP